MWGSSEGMNGNMNHRTRSASLGTACLVILAMAASSCVNIQEELSESREFTFAQICDTQFGMGGYEHDLKTFKQAVVQINALEPDLVVICGDLVGRANEKTFADFKTIKAGLQMPSYCVPGNHDVGNKPTLESLRIYRQAIGKDYYWFKHKGYAFVCVNTRLWKSPVDGETEAQDLWLKATLASAADQGLPIFVVGHSPLYLKQPDEGESYYNLAPARRKELLDLFEERGVVAILSGHAHRIVINDYKGIQLVTGQATSRTHGAPLGFRLWHIKTPRPFKHDSVHLEGF
jgi:predicted MPP superfamily phosphohydrolase